MEQLTIKELAPYLPYNLRCCAIGEFVEGSEFDDKPKPKILTIIGISDNWVDGRIGAVSESIMIEDVKPILRNLSDLTKEIEINGEKFVPIDRLSHKFRMHLDCFGMQNVLDWTVSDYQILLSWHFDVSNLIPRKLAIDLNTL